MPIERKLAAIMFTDIAGYTAQMSKDEAVAISLLNKKESILKPLIAKHNGTYVKSTGDGSLSHFSSAVDAATCAKRFQESIYDDKDLNVRVGVHLGDTIFEKGDIRGDGVNIASRLESMAVAGGVFVSKEVHDQLANQREFEGVSLGLQSMKGVGRLIEVYGLKGDKLSEPNPDEYQENKVAVHTDDEVPSIAIIPFRNKGKDEDVFYAYGICADLISECSSAGLIRVASLEKIEELGDLELDEKAKKLDVRYITTGALWKMDDMFQLSIELYDTKETKVVWSDRWQENWDELPKIKGKLSEGLLKALDMKPKEYNKIDATNTEAYEFYLKGRYKFSNSKNIEDKDISIGLLLKAIEIDNYLLEAKNGLGYIYADLGKYDKAMGLFKSTLEQGLKMGDDRGIGNLGIGYIYRLRGEYKNALIYTNRSLEIDKKLDDKASLTSSYSTLGLIHGLMGDIDKGLDHLMCYLDLSKQIDKKDEIAIAFHQLGLAYWLKGDLNRAFENGLHSLDIAEKLNNWGWIIMYPLFDLGLYNFEKNDYGKAKKYLEKSITIQREIGRTDMQVWTTAYLFLSYKKLGIYYNKKNILTLIEANGVNDDFMYYAIYKLLEDTSYLETAYNQVQEKADNLESDVAAKFLSYPIPKAIVEEWEKVK